MVFLAVLRCFLHRRAFNGSTYPQSLKDAQCNFLCILTPNWLCCVAPCFRPDGLILQWFLHFQGRSFLGLFGDIVFLDPHSLLAPSFVGML